MREGHALSMEAGSRLAVSPIASASSIGNLYWPSTMDDALLFRLMRPGRFAGVANGKPHMHRHSLLSKQAGSHGASRQQVIVGSKYSHTAIRP